MHCEQAGVASSHYEVGCQLMHCIETVSSRTFIFRFLQLAQPALGFP